MIFVSDGYGNNRIATFDRRGRYLSMWGVAARDGHVYVVGRKYGMGPLPTMQSLIEYSLTVDDYPPVLSRGSP